MVFVSSPNTSLQRLCCHNFIYKQRWMYIKSFKLDLILPLVSPYPAEESGWAVELQLLLFPPTSDSAACTAQRAMAQLS